MKKKEEKEKFIRVNITLEPSLFALLKKRIVKSGENRSELVRSALKLYLSSKK